MYAGVQVKLWDPLRMHAIPECLRGVITTRCYTNPHLLYLTLPKHICAHWMLIRQLNQTTVGLGPAETQVRQVNSRETHINITSLKTYEIWQETNEISGTDTGGEQKIWTVYHRMAFSYTQPSLSSEGLRFWSRVIWRLNLQSRSCSWSWDFSVLVLINNSSANNEENVNDVKKQTDLVKR